MDRSDHQAGWRPLLDGELAAAANSAITDIGATLSAAPPDTPAGPESTRHAGDASLAGGVAGEGLFLAYLAAARGDDAIEATARLRVDAAIDLLSTVPMAAGLYSGFTGIAWAVEHLGSRAPGEVPADPEARSDDPDDPDDGDPNDDIDEVLFDHLSSSPWTGDYDVVSGLVGLGVYALERWPRARAVGCLERVVDRLAELAERSGKLATWHTSPLLLPEWQRKVAPDGYYNLGLAHGVAGVVGLLGAAAGLGALPGHGHDLLDGAVAWLLERRLAAADEARWDAWWIPGGDAKPSRSAWCYGDPGVAAALYLAGRGAKRRDWCDAAVAAMVGVAERPADQAGVVDAGLCHGAAGLGHILNRFYQATGDPTIGAAARGWFERLLSMRQEARGLAGFPAYFPTPDGQPRWVDEAGILTGAAGVGLALLAATTARAPDWDRFLLLS